MIFCKYKFVHIVDEFCNNLWINKISVFIRVFYLRSNRLREEPSVHTDVGAGHKTAGCL